MKIFLDTNVILDHALNRMETFAEEATLILELCEVRTNLTGYISSGTLYTLAYVLERAGCRGAELRLRLKEYLALVKPIALPYQKFLKAVNDETFNDMEDSFQYHTALFGECVFFITANLKDFRKSGSGSIAVVSPKEFLASLKK